MYLQYVASHTRLPLLLLLLRAVNKRQHAQACNLSRCTHSHYTCRAMHPASGRCCQRHTGWTHMASGTSTDARVCSPPVAPSIRHTQTHPGCSRAALCCAGESNDPRVAFLPPRAPQFGAEHQRRNTMQCKMWRARGRAHLVADEDKVADKGKVPGQARPRLVVAHQLHQPCATQRVSVGYTETVTTFQPPPFPPESQPATPPESHPQQAHSTLPVHTPVSALTLRMERESCPRLEQ